jgi:hypothetical protein
MRAIAAAATPAEVMRPFLWVAGLAFSTGFLGFLAVAPYVVPAG